LQGIKEKTGETPNALLNRKVPYRWNRQYWEAYQDLSSTRTWSQGGPSEIPYPAKILWLDENDILDKHDRDAFLQVIREIDLAFVNHIAKKLEKK
jgi:hypothetical protein